MTTQKRKHSLRALAVWMTPSDLEKVKEVAKIKRLKASALARLWLMERVNEELERQRRRLEPQREEPLQQEAE